MIMVIVGESAIYFDNLMPLNIDYPLMLISILWKVLQVFI